MILPKQYTGLCRALLQAPITAMHDLFSRDT
jgi:hypothetical protein